MLRKIETVMEWWLDNTPRFMQPRVFWTCYYYALDKVFLKTGR